MKKVIILLPVYNDWESLSKVLEEINELIEAVEINSNKIHEAADVFKNRTLLNQKTLIH